MKKFKYDRDVILPWVARLCTLKINVGLVVFF